ncbi:hypothetical protein PQJ75_08250 [Rhodoplanes sp. TEM]|uniref:Polysaccharide biosynthesis protein n=1 Tax=Rhodoplanes tepidamans TaxID=200616 RepID=A0ABT5JBF3_RHOTP|nr:MULTISPECIES: hypothetical protein [Rhodoplanes]MDC7786711.1 hypothetical protein [Rhodoplanes tepidamans]MDC7983717.1 hypothetical protein [Rhodoplanes sp. TEM]MDQ0358147.1 O-antigen/teichoic acid export membrane protein [Rhodoplanes tepidamans]
MSLRRRTVDNTVANIVGVGLTALAQLATVPVLSAAWGIAGFGTWLMLATIPTWLALGDFGFGTAATAEMIAAAARGERARVVAVFQSVLLLTLLAAATAVALASPLLVADRLPGLPGWAAAHGPAVAVLVAYAAAALVSRLFLAALRASGHYASATIAFETATCLECLAMLGAALLGADHLGCALVLLGCRAVMTAAFAALLTHRVPDLRPGLAHASAADLRRLLSPAVATLAFPIAFAVNIQGMTLVAGTVLSPVAVAVLEPVRTASRVAIQVTGAVNRATMPEFAAATARGDHAAVRKLVAVNVGVAAGVLLPGAAAFVLLGRTVVEIWSGGRIVPEAGFVLLMGIAMLIHGLWHFTANLLLAVNAHADFARVLVASALVSVAAAVPAAHLFGLDGIAGTVLLSESLCLLGVCHAVDRSGLAKAWAPARAVPAP